MKKMILGVILGAVVYYAWSAFSWMGLSWHDSTMQALPEERLIMDTLKTVVDKPGAYFFPTHKTTEGQMDQKAWAEKYKQGPTGLIIYSPGGEEPMTAETFLFAIIDDILIAVIGMLILMLSRDRVKHILPRALLVMSLGVLASLAVHIPHWIWFHFPSDMTWIACADTCIAFLLMGFAMAKFVPES